MPELSRKTKNYPELHSEKRGKKEPEEVPSTTVGGWRQLCRCRFLSNHGRLNSRWGKRKRGSHHMTNRDALQDGRTGRRHGSGTHTSTETTKNGLVHLCPDETRYAQDGTKSTDHGRMNGPAVIPYHDHPTGTLWNSEKNAYVRATQQVNNTATDITSSHLRTEIFVLNFTKLQHVWGKQDKTNRAYSRRGDTHLKLQNLQGTSRKITISQGKPGLHREILLQNKTKFIKGQSKSYTEKGTGHTSVILVIW